MDKLDNTSQIRLLIFMDKVDYISRIKLRKCHELNKLSDVKIKIIIS